MVLEQNGFTVYEAATGEEGLDLAAKAKPLLVLLDLILPGMDGYEVCRKLRGSHPEVAVIMITGCNEREDIIKGLETGADDYVVKPFDSRELLARVKATLRRTVPAAQQNVITFNNIEIFPAARQVKKNGRYIKLSPREYELLLLFAQNPNRAFSRDEILDHLCGQNFFGERKTVDIYVSRLRAQLADEPGKLRLIETVRGTGYIFNFDPE